MRIVSAAEMQDADAATFALLGLPSVVIMENAGQQIVECVLAHFGDCLDAGVVVCVGSGNNGGDGFVVARVLKNIGCAISVIALKSFEVLSGDAAATYKAWESVGGRTLFCGDAEVVPIEVIQSLNDAGVIVDAVFGTGFCGVPRKQASSLICAINESLAPVVCVDLPSGVNATTGSVEGHAVKGSVTVALQALKLGHVLRPGVEFSGDVVVVDIGVQLGSTIPNRKLLTAAAVSSLLRKRYVRDRFVHKGNRGHVLVFGGGSGRCGAVKMSGLGSLHAGAGLVSLAVPFSVAAEMAPSLDELMCLACPDDGSGQMGIEGWFEIQKAISSMDSIVLGPGLGVGEGARAGMRYVLEVARDCEVPVVIDADGLNLLVKSSVAETDVAEFLAGNAVVMTPHPGEAARLLGCSVQKVQEDRMWAVQALRDAFGCTVVLKGAFSLISGNEGDVFVIPCANEVLATAGSGDVLAGVVAALLARGFSVTEAACVGAFVHARAGELCACNVSLGVGVIASEIALSVRNAIAELLSCSQVDVFCRRSLAFKAVSL